MCKTAINGVEMLGQLERPFKSIRVTIWKFVIGGYTKKDLNIREKVT